MVQGLRWEVASAARLVNVMAGDQGHDGAVLPAALRLASSGIRVFPCTPGGKAPLTRNGFKDATTSASQVARWFSRWPGANLAIATGGAGFDVLDVDCHRAGTGFPALERAAVSALAQGLQSRAAAMPIAAGDSLPQDQESLQRHVYAQIFSALAKRNFEMARIFVASFCADGDRLSQWRGYANQGTGYAIGFDWDKMSDLQVIRQSRPQQDVHIVPPEVPLWRVEAIDVMYEDELGVAQRSRDVLQQFDTDTPAFTSVLVNLARVKHPAFSEESERRVIAVHPGARVPDLKFRPSRFGVVPYVEVQVPENALTEVVIGPTLPRGAELAVRDTLRAAFGQDRGSAITIRRSAAPYR